MNLLKFQWKTNASVAGATGKGMQTGPAGYDRIGAGAAYYVDTKFHKSIGMGGMIAAMDKLADEYTARGKENCLLWTRVC